MSLDLIKQMFPPKSKFSVDDIPDLSGKVVIVTGANTGIGKETAKALLEHNAKVYIAARNEEKAKKAIADLKKETGKEGVLLKLDLADLNDVKRAAAEFQDKEKDLHVLFNNAGIWCTPIELLTAQGYDLQFGTNVLGHFYLTKLLLPTLLATAKSSPEGKARVINTSSSASLLLKQVKYDTLTDTVARKRLSPADHYIQSKLANVLFSNELAKRYGDQGIVSVSLNPGNLKSELYRTAGRLFHAIVEPLITYPVSMGALTQLYAGTTKEGWELNGKYLIPWARVGEPNPVTKDSRACEELWSWLETQVETV